MGKKASVIDQCYELYELWAIEHPDNSESDFWMGWIRLAELLKELDEERARKHFRAGMEKGKKRRGQGNED